MTAQKQKLSTVLQELKEEYLQKFPQKIDKLKNLTQAQDWTGLEEEYHKLKGTGKTYGFADISLVCEKLEALAQQPSRREVQIFNEAAVLLEKMHQNYLRNGILDLQKDSFARSLLALKVK